MKYEKIHKCLNFELFRLVRDSAPTEVEVLEWLGYERHGVYHVLRKAQILVLKDGVVRLSPRRLSADGKSFHWQHLMFMLDDNLIYLVHRERCPAGMPRTEGAG